MANKKVSQLSSKPSVLVTDLFPIADPSTGQLYKTTISDLGTAIGSGVSSVNGLVGAVVLDTDDIQELVSPTNKWFTDTRARAAISASSPLAYNSGTGVFSIPAATSSQNGYLTSTDWSTFNNKLSGSGTTNYVPKFTAASVLGNSNIQDDGSLITLGSDSYVNGSLGVGISPSTGFNLSVQRNFTGASISYGIASLGQIQSDVATARYFYSAPSQAAGASTGSVQHFFATQGTFLGTVTSQIGFYVNSTLTGATNNYGFRADLAAATNVWNIYIPGTASNYLAGSLGIGSTSLTGYNLRIGKTITGATSAFGINQDSAIQSDVTSGAIAYGTLLTTQAASFTLSSLYHFRAQQGTFGAGSAVNLQIGFDVATSLVSASQNIGFRSLIPSSLSNYNLLLSGTAANYLAGDTAIGVSPSYASSGPMLTSTLTNGGSGYVDGTYTDVTSGTATTGVGAYALFTVVVSGGIVTSATLTWGGNSYRVGDTLTISNTLLGGSGSGLVITAATVDSSQLKISNANGGDITLFRGDTSLSSGENLGTIKWESNDSTAKASGLQAEIGAYGASTNGGAYLSFSTRSITAGTSLIEAMRIGSEGNVGIGATALTGYNLKVTKNITGSTIGYGISSEGIIQSDVTTQSASFASNISTAAASFTLGTAVHYTAVQGTIGSGSTITNQYGYFASSTLVGATNNYAFFGAIPSGTNRWNLYMNGTAQNYLSGKLLIGSNTDSGYKLLVSGSNQADSTIGMIYTSVGAYSQFITSGGAFVMGLDGSTGSTERLRITSIGNVGINTSTPASFTGYTVFTVNGSTNGGMTVLQYQGTNSLQTYSVSSESGIYELRNNPLAFGTNNTLRMTIKANGIINLSNVPSSATGLSSGDIYKTVAGVLMIV